MPFSSNDEVRGKVVGADEWTESELAVFRESFNDAYNRPGGPEDPEQRERFAFAIAHAARKRSLK